MRTKQPSRPRAGAAQTAALDALRRLPTRRPVDPPHPAASLQWTLVDIDRYEVRAGATTLGYIDVVGAVFVALAGRRYSRAVEVTQTLVFDSALEALQA